MGSLQLNQVKKTYGATRFLYDINLKVVVASLSFLSGRPAGKIHAAADHCGVEDMSGGEVKIDGKRVDSVPPAQRGIAMVFQSYALYPHLTVKENMSAGLRQAKTPKAQIETEVHEASRMLSLGHIMSRRPSELSGGQRQRVAIGRAVVRKPEFVSCSMNRFPTWMQRCGSTRGLRSLVAS